MPTTLRMSRNRDQWNKDMGYNEDDDGDDGDGGGDGDDDDN